MNIKNSSLGQKLFFYSTTTTTKSALPASGPSTSGSI